MKNIPFIDLNAQYERIGDEIVAALGDVCRSSRFILGPTVESFEKAFATYCEAEHCIAVNSGTSALHLAMRCLGIGPGDEVVTTPMTFVATVWAITYVGATPVFVDIDPATRTIDPLRLKAAITPRTKAILPVHLYGQPAEMDALLSIADACNLPVVEDAAQAHGARYKGRRVGALGQIGCFSFYPGKNLGAWGEGGALVTNNADHAAKARALRDHGQRQKHRHDEVGYNYRMDGLQGAVLGIKLRYLDVWNEARRHHAAAYKNQLHDLQNIIFPSVHPELESVFHLFVAELDDRDRVGRELNERGVATGLHYPIPVHLQPAYAHLKLSPGSFPNAERLAKRCLSLPMFPELSNAQILYVCRQLALVVR